MFPCVLKSYLLAISYWASTAASTFLFTVLATAERYSDSYSVSLEKDLHRQTPQQGMCTSCAKDIFQLNALTNHPHPNILSLMAFFVLCNRHFTFFVKLPHTGGCMATPWPRTLTRLSSSWASVRWRGGAGASPGPAPGHSGGGPGSTSGEL